MNPSDPAALLQAVAALAAVLLLLWGGARLLERRGGVLRPQGRLGVRAACALDTRRRLVLIRCDGREALLLTGPAGDAFLGWLPPACPGHTESPGDPEHAAMPCAGPVSRRNGSGEPRA